MPTVLVVDDEPAIRHLVAYSIKSGGLNVVEASNGIEALDIIASNQPDLLVLDVMMPGMTGFQVLREMKTRFPDADLPTILLTAKAELSDKTEGFESGAEDYVTKPFAPKELLMRVQAQLRLKEQRDKLRSAAQGLQQLSATDELTGAYNRRHLLQRIREEFSESNRHERAMSFILFDIDHFKSVNDNYGHLAGDAVLKNLAEVVRQSTRQEDVLARYGGEEFAILLPTTPREIAITLAERIRQSVASKPFAHENLTLQVTISLGVAGIPDDAVEDIEDLIEAADRRLYVAKNSGRNRTVGFDEELAAAA